MPSKSKIKPPYADLIPALPKGYIGSVLPVPRPFDIEIISDEIRSYKQESGEAIYEIGRRLSVVKYYLEHGEWLVWLRDDRINFSERTAHRYMKLANGYPNSTMMANLGCTKAEILLDVPEEDRDAFLDEVHEINGDMVQVSKMNVGNFQKAVNKKIGKEVETDETEGQPDPSDSHDTKETNENSDAVTVFLGDVAYIDQRLECMQKALTEQIKDTNEREELRTLLLDILDKNLQKFRLLISTITNNDKQA